MFNRAPNLTYSHQNNAKVIVHFWAVRIYLQRLREMCDRISKSALICKDTAQIVVCI